MHDYELCVILKIPKRISEIRIVDANERYGRYYVVCRILKYVRVLCIIQ